MVGDGINDLSAMQAADLAILTEQQPGERPAELYGAANHVIQHVDAVVAIVQEMLAHHD
jgi:Cu+-exporting ATPase